MHQVLEGAYLTNIHNFPSIRNGAPHPKPITTISGRLHNISTIVRIVCRVWRVGVMAWQVEGLKMSRPGTRSKTVTLPFFSECSTQVVLFVLFKNICMPSCFHLNVFSTEMIISSYLEILVAKFVKSIQYFHTDGHYSTIIFPQYLHFNHWPESIVFIKSHWSMSQWQIITSVPWNHLQFLIPVHKSCCTHDSDGLTWINNRFINPLR